MISLRSVNKSFRLPDGGRKHVLREVNLDIPSGLSVGVLGANGAGKTTLLRLIAGVDYPDSGSIVTSKRLSPVFGLRSGFSGQLSGRDNVRFVCRIQGDEGAVLREREAYVKDFAELDDYYDMPVRTYSSGMRARLAFALSMAFEYDYYLIDELISVGDRTFRRKARRAFAEKRGRANTILVSHNMKLHRAECDAGLYLKDGALAFFADVREAIAAYQGDAGSGDTDEGERETDDE